MPELPEIEVTRRRLELVLVGSTVERVEIRAAKLRLPVPGELATILPGRTVSSVGRRGKYLLFDCETGWLIIHLGMTGFLRFLDSYIPPDKHDHLDVIFTSGAVLRLHDPRKFGTVVWTTDSPMAHPLLCGIGPEPLTPTFHGDYLFAISRARKVAVKQLIMNAAVVAGVGNIYANESLFRAGIRPDRSCCTLTETECERLVLSIVEVLLESIEQGSSYRITEETVAYYPLKFKVYGRGKEPCSSCGVALEESRLGNRSTVFCPGCQA